MDHPRPTESRTSLMVAAIAALATFCLFAGLAAAHIKPNPANDPRLIDRPLEDFDYDGAHGCREHPPKGTKALARWLDRNTRGESWGIMRCERLKAGKREGGAPASRVSGSGKGGGWSVHSEGRALDWRLDAGDKDERHAAMRLIRTLIDEDRRGRDAAWARRMGVQGLIFNCRAWWSGMSRLGDYSYCYKPNGERRRGLDRTQAHKDHVHIELNWQGAKMRTSFWRSPLRRRG